MNTSGTITMSMTELDRLKVVQAVCERRLKPGQAADRLALSVRQVERHAQRVGDQLSFHVRLHRPAHDLARVQVQYDCQIEPAPGCADVRVSRPWEFHPRPLAEPDVSLSTHPAPIIQPLANIPASNVQRCLETSAQVAREVLVSPMGDSNGCPAEVCNTRVGYLRVLI